MEIENHASSGTLLPLNVHRFIQEILAQITVLNFCMYNKGAPDIVSGWVVANLYYPVSR